MKSEQTCCIDCIT